MDLKRASRIIIAIIFISLSFNNVCYSLNEDEKNKMKQYLNEINPILINLQITSRNMSQRLLPPGAAAQNMDSYIKSMDSIDSPGFMARQHKMILLSFKKMRMGFILLSRLDKEKSVKLVVSSRDLLRMAVNDMVDFAKREGIISGDATSGTK